MTELQITEQSKDQKTEQKISMHMPPKCEMHILKDVELAKLVRDFDEDVNFEQISMVCGWWEGNKSVEPCFNCLKSNKRVMKCGNESDFITLLVQHDLLPEGDYLVMMTSC